MPTHGVSIGIRTSTVSAPSVVRAIEDGLPTVGSRAHPKRRLSISMPQSYTKRAAWLSAAHVFPPFSERHNGGRSNPRGSADHRSHRKRGRAVPNAGLRPWIRSPRLARLAGASEPKEPRRHRGRSGCFRALDRRAKPESRCDRRSSCAPRSRGPPFCSTIEPVVSFVNVIHRPAVDSNFTVARSGIWFTRVYE